MKNQSFKRLLIPLAVLLILIGATIAVFASGLLPATPPSNPTHYTITERDFTSITEKGLHDAYLRAGEIMKDYRTVSFPCVPAKGSLVDSLNAAAEQENGYLTLAFLHCWSARYAAVDPIYDEESQIMTIPTAPSDQERTGPDSENWIRLFIFFAILDQGITSEDILLPISPEQLLVSNVEFGIPIVLLGGYRELGYADAASFRTALTAGKATYTESCFRLNPTFGTLRAENNRRGANLLEQWSTAE